MIDKTKVNAWFLRETHTKTLHDYPVLGASKEINIGSELHGPYQSWPETHPCLFASDCYQNTNHPQHAGAWTLKQGPDNALYIGDDTSVELHPHLPFPWRSRKSGLDVVGFEGNADAFESVVSFSFRNSVGQEAASAYLSGDKRETVRDAKESLLDEMAVIANDQEQRLPDDSPYPSQRYRFVGDTWMTEVSYGVKGYQELPQLRVTCVGREKPRPVRSARFQLDHEFPVQGRVRQYEQQGYASDIAATISRHDSVDEVKQDNDDVVF